MLKHLSKIRHLKLYSLLILLIAVGGGIGFGVWYQHHHSAKRIVTAGAPVKYALPKETQPAQKTPSANNSGATNAGGATDTHGSVTSTNPSHWTTSASGIITVKSPAPNSTLKSGDVVSGTSKTSAVSYRLSDNKVGVIAQGTLGVVGGNFSGVLHFTPQGTGGRLDIFSTDSSGVEYNEVQINVSF